MLKKIIGTTGSRLICSILGFAALIIAANEIGQEGVGVIYGQIVLGITIVVMLSNFVGGGALIYLIPRHDTFKIFILSYFWAFFSAIIGTFILYVFKLIPESYEEHVFFLSLIQSFLAANYNILLGKEKIKIFNIINIIQSSALFLSLICFIYLFENIHIDAFVYSLFFGFGFAFLISLIWVSKEISITNLKGLNLVIKEVYKFGFFVQFAGIIQLLNYRLSYYLIEFFICRPAGSTALLGLYTTSNQLSEGTWLVGKSVATVQYSKISNTDDNDYSIRLTLSFLKFTFTITVLILSIILLLPEAFYTSVFGAEFINIKPVLYSLAVGILAVSITMIFTHYFSGTGQHYINTIGSAIGFVFTLVLGLILIPKYNIIGAGITASAAYSASSVFAFVMFVIKTKTRFKNFLISKKDFGFIRSEVKSILR